MNLFLTNINWNLFFIELFAALLILFLGFAVGKLVGIFLYKILLEFNFDKLSRKVDFSLSRAVSDLVSVMTYIGSAIIAFSKIGLLNIIVYTAAALIFVILIGNIILNFFDVFPNLYAGLVLKFGFNLRKGSEIKTTEVKGKIERINILNTTIITSKDERIFLPSSYVLHNWNK